MSPTIEIITKLDQDGEQDFEQMDLSLLEKS